MAQLRVGKARLHDLPALLRASKDVHSLLLRLKEIFRTCPSVSQSMSLLQSCCSSVVGSKGLCEMSFDVTLASLIALKCTRCWFTTCHIPCHSNNSIVRPELFSLRKREGILCRPPTEAIMQQLQQLNLCHSALQADQQVQSNLNKQS